MFKQLSLIFPLFLCFLVLYPLSPVAVLGVDPVFSQANYSSFLSSINLTNVRGHVEYFSQLQSRFTGYPGSVIAAEYIREYFASLGLSNVSYQNFTVQVPVDYGAAISIVEDPNLDVNIYPLLPNMVSPTTCKDLEGKLVYVGDGSFQEFDGNPVNNSIVIMNFNSGRNWIRAAEFGAKTVIFIEPEETTLAESLRKCVDIPFKFPRFYVKTEDASKLLAALNTLTSLHARITSKMVWEEKEGFNVMSVLPGSDPQLKDKIILLTASYDSYSVVPSISPGANDAVGISTLLELARVLTMFRPKYTVMFVAFSGHYQILKGSRTFQYEYYYGDSLDTGEKILMQVNLQLSARNGVLGVLNLARYIWGSGMVWGYRPGFTGDYYQKLINFMTGPLINEINEQADQNFKLINTAIVNEWDTSFIYKGFPSPRSVKFNDAEPFSYEGIPAISLNTLDTGDFIASPIDDYSHFEMSENSFTYLKHNVQGSSCIIYGLLTMDNLESEYLEAFEFAPRACTLKGIVARYEPANDSYVGIPDALVFMSYPTGSPGWSWDTYARWEVVRTSKNGSFIIHIAERGQFNPLDIYAFKLNDTTGDIIYAPDHGRHQWAPSSSQYSFSMNTLLSKGGLLDIGYYTVFESASIVLFDAFYHPTMGTWVSSRVKVLERATETTPESFGLMTIRSVTSALSLSVAWVPPNLPVAILLDSPYLNINLGLMVNATKGDIFGSGYSLKTGEQYVAYNTPIIFAEQLIYAQMKFLNRFVERGIPVEEYLKEIYRIEQIIDGVKNATGEYQYSKAYSDSFVAWSRSQSLYVQLANQLTDTVNTVPFFSFFLIIFVLLLERLLFPSQGKKRILSMIIAFVIVYIVFNGIHPGFLLSANPLMVVIAFFTGILLLPIFYTLMKYMQLSINEMRRKVRGYHYVEMSKESVMSLAFQLGIEYLKKRKLRSILTFLTTAILVSSLVLFTSITSITVLSPAIIPGRTPPYQGFYIRDNEWKSLSKDLLLFLENKYSGEATVLPKVWMYPHSADELEIHWFNVSNGEKNYKFYGFLGLTPEEAAARLNVAEMVDGRWFLSSDIHVCILPRSIAEYLGVKSGGNVTILDKTFTIAGVVDDDFLNALTDMDGEPLTPLDLTVGQEYTIHVDASLTVIVPYKFLEMYNVAHGFRIASISVVPKDANMTIPIMMEVYNALPGLWITGGVEDKVIEITQATTQEIFGFRTQIVPILLVVFVLLNTMIGNVQQRTGDIFTFSTVGLSPMSVGIMFLAENVVFAIVGGIIGYVAAMGVLVLVPTGITPNYSSSWVVTTMSIAMGVTVLASIYPMFKASRLVTPSLEREWKIPTKPKGNLWEVPFPLVIKEDEVMGIFNFIREYIETTSQELAKFKATELEVIKEPSSLQLRMVVALAPYEHGVKQKVNVEFIKDEKAKTWSCLVLLERLSGNPVLWPRLVKVFLDYIRKQLLLWRSLTNEQRERYLADRVE